MKRLISFFVVFLAAAVLLIFSLMPAKEPGPPVSEANAENYATLLADLVYAREASTTQDARTIAADLDAIRAVDRRDLPIAEAIAHHWQTVYLDPDYRLFLHHGGELAEELADAGIPENSRHAIVVLGFALQDGEMQPELMGRCDAAAAMARSYPSAILVCSGGATGTNNPEGHTEAGLMRDYLAEHCEIDPSRIFIDEKATTTAENAVNTLEILRANGIRTMTIVTSAYHQRRGQTLYNATAALFRQQYGYSVRIVGNYCYDIDSSSPIEAFDARVAASQIAGILGLPEEARQILPSMRGAFSPPPADE